MSGQPETFAAAAFGKRISDKRLGEIFGRPVDTTDLRAAIARAANDGSVR